MLLSAVSPNKMRRAVGVRLCLILPVFSITIPHESQRGTKGHKRPSGRVFVLVVCLFLGEMCLQMQGKILVSVELPDSQGTKLFSNIFASLRAFCGHDWLDQAAREICCGSCVCCAGADG